jgi:hypothetical protein
MAIPEYLYRFSKKTRQAFIQMPALMTYLCFSLNDLSDGYFLLIVPSQVLMQVSFLSSSLNHREVTHFDSV